MSKFARLAFLAVPLLIAVPSPVVADEDLDETCVVADPTGTPLNIRDEPNGDIIGTIRNGRWVWATALRYSRGSAWVFVWKSDKDGNAGDRLGWVYYEHLNCR